MRASRFFWTILLMAVTISMAAAQEVRLVFSVEGRGDFTIRLNTKEAPKTCARIAELAQSGFYNGLRFHRALRQPKPYLVQIGDPRSKDAGPDVNLEGNAGSGQAIPFEQNSLAFEAGTVGLARLPDKKDSGDSQFFILLSDAKFLEGSYTAFGKVVTGMDVVAKIEKGDRITQVKVLR